MVLVYSGPHTRENFYEKVSSIWARAGPILGRQSVRRTDFKGRKIISLPGAPTYLGANPCVRPLFYNIQT
jgi:hypothetical protein